MVTTRGFRDVIEIRRGTKDDLWDAYKDVAPPYIRRRDRLRGDRAGRLRRARSSTPLDEDEARERRRGFCASARSRRSRSASSTPTRTRHNEQPHARDPRGGAARASRLDLERASCPRSSSTSASRPRSRTPCSRRSSAATCSGSSERLDDGGYDGDLLLLHSGGGVMTPKTAERFAVRLAASGIAAGAIAAPPHRGAVRLRERDRPRHGRHEHRHLARLRAARCASTNEWFVEYGHPICFPSIEVLTIGAGGGSLAWIDDGRLAAQRPAVGGRRPRPRLLRPAAARSRRTPTPTSCSAGSATSWSAAR